MRRDARREAQEAEDDVLDPRPHVALAEGAAPPTAPRRPGCSTTDTSCAPERPERVLVRAQLAEVEPVAVDVVDVAELAGVGDLLQLRRRPGGTRAGGRPSATRPALSRGRRDLLGVGRPTAPAASRRSSACPPRAPATRAPRAWARAWRPRPRRARRRASSSSRSARSRASGEAAALQRSSASWAPSQSQRSSAPGSAVEVAGEVRAPVAEADDADPDRVGVTDAPGWARSLPRVTPRKSTTSGAAASTLSKSRPGWRGDDDGAVARRRAPASSGSRRQVVLGQLGHVAGRGRRCRRRARASRRMIFSAGDSRRSPTPGL